MNDIERRFTYHDPDKGRAERHAFVRAKAKELAELVCDACPDGRERSLALTKIEEAVMWANASIAREGVD